MVVVRRNGGVLKHFADTPPSVHGIQDLEERFYAEAWLFSIDAAACFAMHVVEQLQ
jgi:hypothetical protein